jgi:hypothetical protein
MKKFRGQIRNEKGEVIFSRKGSFESKEKCIEVLEKRVYETDIPSKDSFLYNFASSLTNTMIGNSFETSPYCLSRYYKDISKLTFSAEELN